MNRILGASLTALGLGLMLALPACDSSRASMTENQPPKRAVTEGTDDIVARVGDQPIRFSDLNVMLNSSAVVGVSIPAVGTPERDKVRITLLDRFISANLLYLDAIAQGLDESPVYRREVRRFSDGTLAALYRQRYLVGDIAVTEDEVQKFYDNNVAAGTELSDELRTAIEAALRRDKLKARMVNTREQLRAGMDVVLYHDNLSPSGDGQRADTAPLATFGGQTITWGELKNRLMAAGRGAIQTDPLAMEQEGRLAALESEIDTRIMAQKARDAGLEGDPVYRARYEEFGKTRLINMHKEKLVSGMDTSDATIKVYYEENRARIMQPEMRKVQMVVVKTKGEADDLKRQMDTGEITMFQAALEHSIAPRAKQDLGEIGWVNRGEALERLDAVIFDLQPGAIGGPVETPAGWHLVKVLDVREARLTDFADAATRKAAKRRYVHERLDAYVVDLRKSRFPVEVYEDVLVRLAQNEANAVAELAEQAKDPSSVTQKRLTELGRQLKNP